MAVASRRTGKYYISDEFPERFNMLDVGELIEFLEKNGFEWRPLVKAMDPNHLGQSFGNHKCYCEGRTVAHHKNIGIGIPEWFAFGDENRVYMVIVVDYDKRTGRFEYVYEIQQKNKITMGFQNYLQFRDSAIRYFGLE